jgi:hypothetical protein
MMKPSPAAAYAPDPNGAYAMTVANTNPLNNGAQLAAPQMQCQPYEEAVLRRAFVAGREVTDVTCITRMNSAALPQAAYAQPIAYQQPAGRDDIVSRPAARRAVTSSSRARVSESRSERSWGKTAMIIGGTTGAGAGLGGLIGGKKGALLARRSEAARRRSTRPGNASPATILRRKACGARAICPPRRRLI